MSIVTKKIGFTIELDEEAIAPASPDVFVFQLINRLNYEHRITSVTVDNVTVPITKHDEVSKLPLREGKRLDEKV
jgi:hypothetical protein